MDGSEGSYTGTMTDSYSGADQERSSQNVPAFAGDGSRPAAAAAASNVELERIPVSDDTDTLTRQTVAKMCEYIRDGITDPNVRMCMGAAIEKLGLGRVDPFSLA